MNRLPTPGFSIFMIQLDNNTPNNNYYKALIMMPFKQIPLQFLLLLLFGVNKVPATCPEDELYVIRATYSRGVLVLDGSEPPQVRLQIFNGLSPQLWQFKRGSKVGFNYVVNNHTGNVLDFAQADITNIVMNKRNNGLQQQWILNSNGRIANAANQKDLDVWEANFTSGNRLILVDDNGSWAQHFDLQKVNGTPNVEWCKYLLTKPCQEEEKDEEKAKKKNADESVIPTVQCAAKTK